MANSPDELGDPWTDNEAMSTLGSRIPPSAGSKVGDCDIRSRGTENMFGEGELNEDGGADPDDKTETESSQSLLEWTEDADETDVRLINGEVSTSVFTTAHFFALRDLFPVRSSSKRRGRGRR